MKPHEKRQQDDETEIYENFRTISSDLQVTSGTCELLTRKTNAAEVRE